MDRHIIRTLVWFRGTITSSRNRDETRVGSLNSQTSTPHIQTASPPDPPTQHLRSYQHRPIIAADALILRLTATFGCAGFALLVVQSLFHDWNRAVAGLIYGATLAASSVASMVYNRYFRHLAGTRGNRNWRMLDHIAIFLLIAGTYTPFAWIGFSDGGGYLLPLVWTLAGIGIVLKFIVKFRFPMLFVALYMAMGWVVIIGAERLFTDLDPVVLGLLFAGGVAYTVGVPFHLLKNWVWYSAVWHGFVLTASVIHFVAIWAFILPVA